jgi:hypothetical protein
MVGVAENPTPVPADPRREAGSQLREFRGAGRVLQNDAPCPRCQHRILLQIWARSGDEVASTSNWISVRRLSEDRVFVEINPRARSGGIKQICTAGRRSGIASLSEAHSETRDSSALGGQTTPMRSPSPESFTPPRMLALASPRYGLPTNSRYTKANRGFDSSWLCGHARRTGATGDDHLGWCARVLRSRSDGADV